MSAGARIRGALLTFNRSAMPAQSSLIAPDRNILRYPVKLGPAGERDDDPDKRAPSERGLADGEDLPYKVELWSEGRTSVEQVLAVTVNGSIGYAAYYAATREHPDRYITLRHKNRIVSRWNEPKH
jgi:hypothetical protein